LQQNVRINHNNADFWAHKDESKEELAELDAHECINKLGLAPISL
jgi:hypothetical protein